jgi:hypothetical protein
LHSGLEGTAVTGDTGLAEKLTALAVSGDGVFSTVVDGGASPSPRRPDIHRTTPMKATAKMPAEMAATFFRCATKRHNWL